MLRLNWRLAQVRSKYGNRKTVVDGATFDSKREAERYRILKLWSDVGEITRLELQPKFKCVVNGKLICAYRADFRYCTRAGKTIVEDVKSPATKTAVYRLKKKLVQALYDIDIEEVM